VIRASHFDASTETVDTVRDARVVRRDDYIIQIVTRCGRLVDPLDHRSGAQQREDLSRVSRRVESRGYDCDRCHAAQSIGGSEVVEVSERDRPRCTQATFPLGR
jgi:hypothetical protein